MTNSIFVSSKQRSTWQKVCAAFLMLSLNLTGGIAATLFTADVAYAADTTFKSPTSAVSPNEWTSPTNAFSSNDLYASASDDSGSSRDDQRYTDFGFSVPAGSTINGIEVSLEGHSSAPISTLISSTDGSFGTGGTSNDVPAWQEDDNDGVETVALGSGTGDDTVSPNGGRFARISDDGYICYPVDGSGLSGMEMKYYWRGDSQAESDETATVQYKVGNSCSNSGSWITLATHNLDTSSNDTTSWSSLQSVSIPNLNTFVVRFKNGNQSSSDETFRVDGVSLVGTQTSSGCEIEARIGDGTNFSSYKPATLTGSDATYTLGGIADLWSGVTWTSSDFSNPNFRLEVRGNDPGSSCYDNATLKLDHAQAKVYFTPPQENTLQLCSDSLDNDNDEQTDLTDSDCASFKPQITVIKHVVGGEQLASFFDIFVRMVDEPFTAVATVSGNESGATVAVNPGSYNIQEDGYANYNTSYSGTCNPRNLVAGDTATCTVTNTYVPPTGTLTVVKKVVNTAGGDKAVSDFVLKVCPTDSPVVTFLDNTGLVTVANAIAVDPCITVTSESVTALTPGWYQVSEINPSEWHYTMNRTAGTCDSDGKVHVGSGEAKSCEMTNTYIAPPACSDGRDNDEDDMTDYPSDPGCTSAEDNSETDPAPQACTDITSTLTRTSNTADVHVGSATGPLAVAVGYIHGAWTASIPGATWVWSESPITNGLPDPIDSFFDVFQVVGTPTGGTLTIAGDNTFEVYMNGTLIGQDVTGGTFGGPVTMNTGTTIVSGENTLEVRVKNLGVGETQSNPAGLLYSLTVDKNACVVDVCPNIQGDQPTLPDGYEMNEGQCVEIVACNPEVNLLKNAGFETPVMSGWGIVPFGGVLEWLGAFVNPSNTDNLGLEIQNNVAGTPFEGSNLAELDGYHPVKIWQNVVTKPGYDYSLTFKYSPRPGYGADNNVLEVRKDGVALGAQISRGSTSGDTEWSTETRNFVANAASASIEFADVSATDDSLGTYLDDAKLSCVGVHVPKAMVEVTKILCDNESDLPDWSGTGKVIDAYTAQEFVDASDGACHIDPTWKFQWAPTSMSNPGDNTGEDEEWNTFVSTAFITLGDMTSVWVREVMDNQHIPFTGTGEEEGEKMVSAEFYCNGDVLHYDNLDYANGLTDGGTVYCVALNVPILVDDTPETSPENNPEACTDNVDNDLDEAIDGNDSDCTPTLTVIKHVINDNGGTKDAEDFTLHVNQPEVVENNQCDEGYYWDDEEEECIRDYRDALNTVLNFFTAKTAYAGIALFSPDTFPGEEEGSDVSVAYETDYVVTEDADALYTTTMSADCTGHIAIGEHKTCTVTNDDIAQGGGGGGSSSFDYWGCTNPAATNYNPLANRDDGSCQVPGGTPPTGGETPQGEVLGASTVTEPEMPLPPSCAANPYITDFMKMGKKNDVEQVKLLQTFLNEYMGTHIPVTGFFGPLTKAAVKKLQKDNHAEIMQPWIDAGFSAASLKEGTGVVYKTTKYFINKKKCAELTETLPNLANDPGLTD